MTPKQQDTAKHITQTRRQLDRAVRKGHDAAAGRHRDFLDFLSNIVGVLHGPARDQSGRL
jgi:hypothetical protein